VGYYSSTDLTYPEKDKLAAMAAVVRSFDRVLPGRYLAGIFDSDLHNALLWISKSEPDVFVPLERHGWKF